MKILYYFRELNTPMYYWQRIHFFDELKHNNIKIVSFNPLNYSSYNEANEMVIKEIKSTHYDLFLTCVDQSFLYPETITEISKIGIPTCLICWDNLELPYKHKEIAPLFDLVWLTSFETKYLFEKWNCKKVIFQPYAANPYAFRPHWDKPIPNIGFIGSPYGSRTNKINLLTKNGIPTIIYSDSLFNKNYNSSVGIKQFDIFDIGIKFSRYLRFPIGRKVLYTTLKNRFFMKERELVDNEKLIKHPSVDDEEMHCLYSNLSLSLNISELRDTYVSKQPIHKIHLRAFEIPMCGGLEIASYSEELARYFEQDKEIIMYQSDEEFIDKCKFFLSDKNQSLIMPMKIAARKRAERDHTWSKRFEKVFRAL